MDSRKPEAHLRLAAKWHRGPLADSQGAQAGWAKWAIAAPRCLWDCRHEKKVGPGGLDGNTSHGRPLDQSNRPRPTPATWEDIFGRIP